jgi:1-acyl-sn-glycerol-3-phosphate acyltransferase
MILERPVGRVLVAWGYTMVKSAEAMGARALGADDARLRAQVRAWAVGLGPRLGIEVRAFGVEAVDWSKAYVIMANHQSYLDVMALYAALPLVVGFVAKKELTRIPFFSGVMRAVGCVPVDRSRHREAVGALREAADLVRAGTTIAVFPEGTRSAGDRVLPLKKGPFHLAQLASVPVLPVGLRGAGRCMPRSNTAVYPGVIEVHVGRPIPPAADTSHEARRALLETTRREIARLADLPMMG